MSKSRVESAVQELPPRRKSDASSLRPLDNLLRVPVRVETDHAETDHAETHHAETHHAETHHAESLSTHESVTNEGPFMDSDGVDDVLFDDIVFDEVVFDEAEPRELEASSVEPYESPSRFEASEAGSMHEAFAEQEPAPAQETARDLTVDGVHGSEIIPFADALLEKLIRELRGPLSTALSDAERVLVEPERIAIWFENQASRRLLALAGRFSDELRATEVKRVLTSPPAASKD